MLFVTIAIAMAAQAQPTPALTPLPGYGQPDPNALWFNITGPAKIETGAVTLGSAVASAPIAHGVTGRLRAPWRFNPNSWGRAPLATGTPVYATRLDGRKLSWCAPQAEPHPKTGETMWRADCAVPSSLGLVHGKAYGGGLFVGRVESLGRIDAMDVAPQPVSFDAKLRVVYRFEGWSKNGASLRAFVVADDRTEGTPLHSASGTKQADGTVRVSVMGGEVLLSPGANKKSAVISVIKEPRPAGGRINY